jgi:hypothetical protein
MSANQEREGCPNCGRLHEHGPYMRHQAGDKRFVCPNDITCECGATLRMVVPLFKVNESGWHWAIVMPDKKRVSEESL